MRSLGLVLTTLFFSAPAFGAARLDVSTGYRLRALSYKNTQISDPPADKSFMQRCFSCHQAIQSRDFVFTRYAP